MTDTTFNATTLLRNWLSDNGITADSDLNLLVSYIGWEGAILKKNWDCKTLFHMLDNDYVIIAIEVIEKS